MGYMSEVVFAVEADAVPTMLAWCEQARLRSSSCFSSRPTPATSATTMTLVLTSFTGAVSSGQKAPRHRNQFMK